MALSTHAPKFLAIFIFLTLTAMARAASIDATCYLPNGTAAYDNTGVMPYTPCNTKTKHSMCCRSNSTDTCRSDGLCNSSWDGNIWRDFCTDPTWQAPNCIKLCLFNGKDGDGNSGGSVTVTQCDNGSYCCGAGTVADSCCSSGGGLWIGKGGNPTNIRPGAVTSATTKEQTTVTTSATSTDPTTDPVPQTTVPAPGGIVTQTTTRSTTNTGAIAGGVVAGVVAVALILAATIWAMKKRRDRPMNQKPMSVPHADTKPPLYAGEMEGSNAHGELPADTGIHEMSTGGTPMKQHRMVELA